jgi:hypothetical protein
MLYPGEAMGELHTGNGPLADTDLANGEVEGDKMPGQPSGEYLKHRDYDELALYKSERGWFSRFFGIGEV